MRREDIITQIARDITVEGGEMYYVGGYVRDEIMGINVDGVNDIDIEVYKIHLEKLKEVLSRYGEVKFMGKSYEILQIKGYDIDFSIPHSEMKNTQDISLQEALRRRDFRFNAMAMDCLTKKLYDYFQGQKDIKEGRIRHTDKDSFMEDPLRVYRACQFSARFNMKIDEDTMKLCKNLVPRLKNIPQERIYEEFNKALLKSQKPSVFFDNMREMGIVKEYFPELYAMVKCDHNNPYYQEGTIWTHTMMVLDRAAKFKKASKNPRGFMYLALCHDMGKPVAKKDQGDRSVFDNHGEEGVAAARSFLSRLTIERRLKDYVLEMTKNHMKLFEFHRGEDNKDSDFKLKKFFIHHDIDEIMLISIVDSLGRTCDGKLEELEIMKEWMKNKRKKLKLDEAFVPLIKGDDLIQQGFKPSREFVSLLDRAEDLQIKGKSKEEILQHLKECSKKTKKQRLY
ncbi:MAG: CCA tRNA nucleotidyltransferase [Clostridiaceae bacterium]|nr:CCA tRNA nucleotidyltransferase [Clostridiaceae bacterium]